jgi:hypothetical protein
MKGSEQSVWEGNIYQADPIGIPRASLPYAGSAIRTDPSTRLIIVEETDPRDGTGPLRLLCITKPMREANHGAPNAQSPRSNGQDRISTGRQRLSCGSQASATSRA